jgi:hypothetical protein
MPLNIRFVNQSEISSDDVSTDADERAWADRIRAGDMDAFEALYRTYWQRLYAFAFRYVHSKEDAEEVAQDVFFRIWRGRADWVPAGAVRRSRPSWRPQSLSPRWSEPLPSFRPSDPPCADCG